MKLVLSSRLLWHMALLAGVLLAPLGLQAQAAPCMLVPVALSQRLQAASLEPVMHLQRVGRA